MMTTEMRKLQWTVGSMQYRKTDHINSNKGKSYRDSPHLHCVDILLYSLHNLYHPDHCRSQGIQDGTLQQIRATITVQLHQGIQDGTLQQITATITVQLHQDIQDGTLQQITATITEQLHPVMVTDDVTLPWASFLLLVIMTCHRTFIIYLHQHQSHWIPVSEAMISTFHAHQTSHPPPPTIKPELNDWLSRV